MDKKDSLSGLSSVRAQSKTWLMEQVFPLWLRNGFDRKLGNFVEALSPEGQPLSIDRRAMVQARQIYSLRLALERNWISSQMQVEARQQIQLAVQSLLTDFSLPNGSFVRSITSDGKHSDISPDLYTQAFSLFGLANSYRVEKNEFLRKRALALVQYLKKERQVSHGGFSELQAGKTVYEANPHMHLFEAAVAWMEVDSEPVWSDLATSIMHLCLDYFIDPETGNLAEHFDSAWKPIVTDRGFVVEPGHQYEWAWLLQRFEKLGSPKNLQSVRNRLYQSSEKNGINPQNKAVFDEIWSNGSIKTATSRFWPQCERIKCAANLPGEEASAGESMDTLLQFFKTPVQGLWADRMDAKGQLIPEVSKASSLYHIAGAIAEFTNRLEQKT